MFLIVPILFLSFLIGFVCPPVWIVTLLALRQMVRHGRAIIVAQNEAQDMARIKLYRSFSA